MDVFKTDLPTIGRIKKNYGEDFTQAYIETWIINLCEFVNIGKNMSDSQVYETAMMILDEFYYLTLADINLVFKRAKSGFYGQIYDRLDGQIILSWFRLYDAERCSQAADISIREAKSFTDRNERLADREIKRLNDIEINMAKR